MDETIKEIKKDLNELFNRIRKLETARAVAVTKEESIVEKIDEFKALFEKHDKNEMQKYEKIEKKMALLFRYLYLVSGAGLVLSFIGFDNIRKFIIGG